MAVLLQPETTQALATRPPQVIIPPAAAPHNPPNSSDQHRHHLPALWPFPRKQSRRQRPARTTTVRTDIRSKERAVVMTTRFTSTATRLKHRLPLRHLLLSLPPLPGHVHFCKLRAWARHMGARQRSWSKRARATTDMLTDAPGDWSSRDTVRKGTTCPNCRSQSRAWTCILWVAVPANLTRRGPRTPALHVPPGGSSIPPVPRMATTPRQPGAPASHHNFPANKHEASSHRILGRPIWLLAQNLRSTPDK